MDAGASAAAETVAQQRKAAVGRRWAFTHVAGLVLLLLWAIWLGLSLWAAPVPSTGDALRSAADHGQVTDLNRVGSPPQLSGEGMLFKGHGNSTDSTGSILVWTTREGHRYYTDAQTVPGPIINRGVTSGSMFSGDGSHPSYVDRVTAYVLNRTHFHSGIAWAGLAQLALIVCAIGAVIGSKPRRGTRWFWFWVINLPLGVGVLWFAVSEQLRDRAPMRRRWRGSQGFALGILGFFLIQAAVAGAQPVIARM